MDENAELKGTLTYIKPKKEDGERTFTTTTLGVIQQQFALKNFTKEEFNQNELKRCTNQ